MIVERTVATQLKTLQLILVCFVALISNRLSTGYIQNLGTMKLEMVQVVSYLLFFIIEYLKTIRLGLIDV